MRPTTAARTALSRLLRQAETAPRLGRDQELELGRRIQGAGDREAAAALAVSHLRSVIQVARGFAGYGLPLDDLVSEGNVGLALAVARFEPERGLRFYTYARYWIRACILGYVVAHSSVVRRSTGSLQSRLFFGLKREHARLLAQHGDEDVVAELLAAHFATDEGHINAALHQLRGRDVSLDAPMGDEPGAEGILDRLPDAAPSAEERVGDIERRLLVHRAIEAAWPGLDDRERAVLRDRLVADQPLSLRELGERFGVSRERIRQVESALIARLRRWIEAREAPGLADSHGPAAFVAA